MGHREGSECKTGMGKKVSREVTAERGRLQPGPTRDCGVWSLICPSKLSRFSPHKTCAPWMSPTSVWWWQSVNYPPIQDTEERVTLFTSSLRDGRSSDFTAKFNSVMALKGSIEAHLEDRTLTEGI